MNDGDIVSWNVIIGKYIIHSYNKDALKLFDVFKNFGTDPNSTTFVCVLLACNHAVLVDDGCKCFKSMSESNCIRPRMYHYIIMLK